MASGNRFADPFGRRDMLKGSLAVGGMPDGIPRWGYNDTLIGAAFEAIVMPVLQEIGRRAPIRSTRTTWQPGEDPLTAGIP